MAPLGSASPIEIGPFAAITCGIVVFFIGERLTARFSMLRAYSIPEPVSGGVIAALISLGVVIVTGRKVAFDLHARDFLLVYFFATIGLNARLSDLVRGGPLLAVLLMLTIGYMFIQNGVGIFGAALWGLPPQAGLMLGTVSLIGGHGTAIAWGPVVEQQHDVLGAAELGIATATAGLIVASVLGGPIARLLIDRNRLSAEDHGNVVAKGAETDVATADDPITNRGLMRGIFWIHVSIGAGFFAHEALAKADVMLPLFVPCLLSGILLSNTLPKLWPKLNWPAGSASMALISEFSLSVFLAMSLMSMELWSLAGKFGVLATTMLLQTLLAAAFIILIVFRAAGRNYFAAVISAGFTGVILGATPTAIANMTAVTHRYGPSPLAFIVLPLISAFFVDIANAIVIQFFLSRF
jgi:ESS family glutamate:Na+ symporter